MFRSLDARAAPVATLRALRTPDFSVLVQSGGPMFLPARYRSFHVIGIPLAHFARRFRALTGDSPYAIVLGGRVEHAKYLLTARRRPISEVAYATGFTDQSHLSRTFQRLVGTTPALFRDLHHRTAERLTSTNLQDRD